MGVDIATYRGRIGTFSHNFGLDVITVECIVNFSQLMKGIGSVAFIGILLIIAGIEQNPGPKEKEDKSIYTSVLIKVLPTFIEKLNLDKILINLMTKGTLSTDQLKDISKEQTISDRMGAFVSEISKNGAEAYNVLKTALKESDQENLANYLGEVENEFTSTDGDGVNSNVSSLSATERVLPQEEKSIHTSVLTKVLPTFTEKLNLDRILISLVTKGILSTDQLKDITKEQTISDRMGAFISEISKNGAEAYNVLKTALKESDQENLAHYLEEVETEFTSTDGDGVNANVSSLLATESVLPQVSANELTSTADQVQKGSDICYEIVDKSQNTKEDAAVSWNAAELKRIITELGLTEQIKTKITISEAIQMDLSDDESKTYEYNDIPFMFLQRLLSGNSDAMDYESYNTRKNINSKSRGSVLDMYQRKENRKISPLDLFLLVFQCCDPMLKQLLFQKLYICKLALPFIYTEYPSTKSVMSVWPLRSLVVETSDGVGKMEEFELLDLPINVVSFARFGRPNFSKSNLLNGFLCNKGCDTFFHKDRPLGMSTRYCTGGYVEMFVLPVMSRAKSNLKQPVLLLNLRGDVKTDFEDPVCDFISRISDVIAIIIDSNAFGICSTLLEETIKRFSTVLLIFNGPLGPPDGETFRMLQTFVRNVKSRHKMLLQIFSTYSEIDEKNYTDIITETRETISELLFSDSIVTPRSLQDRLGTSSIETDENECCNEACKSANSIIELMDKISSPDKWAEIVTPIQNTTSKELGVCVKASYRNKDSGSFEVIRTRISELRDLQESRISPSIKSFSHCLIEHENDLSYIHYLLSWMKILLERRKRTCARAVVNQSFRCSEDIKDGTVTPKNSNSTYLEIDHIFREIGHISDFAICSKTDHKAIGLPPIPALAKVVATLVAGGCTLELLDGNSFYLPTEWIKSVLTHIHKLIGEQNVLAVSVLGVQSSGKSTLLNSMFGLKFPTSSGRCTKGMHMQIIKVKRKSITDQRKPPFEYILLIDTEGVRAPELFDTLDTGYRRDNEMSTIITGIGDILMVNVMGENSSEMRDILQIVSHAFLRLKLANERLNLLKCCFFIHQNVSDMRASAKLKQGLQQSVKNLDKATEEAACFEGISGITTFNDVIEFNPESHVWYLPNVWQGHPPMYTVNQKYCEKAVELKHHLVDKSINKKGMSFKTLKDTVLHIEDLWKGVLAENFVFSFRNSIEKKAYFELEQKLRDELCSLECSFDSIIFQKAQNDFARCDNVSSLIRTNTQVISEMKQLIIKVKKETLENMEKFFTEHNYKDIMVKWKEHSMKRINIFCVDVVANRRPEIDRLCNNREVDIKISTLCIKHEEGLRRELLKLEKELVGKDIIKEDANKKFEQVWKLFVEESLGADISSSFDPKDSLKEDFLDCLRDMYENHEPQLQSCLADHNYLEKNLEIKMLSGSFEKTGIQTNDISIFSGFGRRMKEVFLKTDFNSAKEAVQSIFVFVDHQVEHICQKNQTISYRDVRQFLNTVLDSMKKVNRQNKNSFTFTITGILKVVVHVSCYSYFRFKEANFAHRQSQDFNARLEKYREIERERFLAHLLKRKSEDTAACLMRHTIENYLRVEMKENISMKVKIALMNKLPSLKYILLIEMLTDLVREKSFDHFMRYILSPKGYAEAWVAQKAEHTLFSENLYEKIAGTEISKYLYDIEVSLSESIKKFPGDTFSIKEWFQHFISLLTVLKLPKDCFHDVEKEFEVMERVCVPDFKNKVIAELKNTEKVVLDEFKSTTKETVRWSGFNPIKAIFKDVWGCPDICVFCGEPCMRGYAHEEVSTHTCIQHKPLGCSGAFDLKNGTILLKSCHVNVMGDAEAPCAMIDFKCNPKKRTPCKKEFHPFKSYKMFVPEWDIEPSNFLDDKATFWKWFIGKYDKQLGRFHRMEVTNVPDTWKLISDQEALHSLRDIYYSDVDCEDKYLP
ncbi:interferon-induced very large GTPase 1-like [Mercenaria mercenaria]|uniref:interferon-induced very large GTPase 1-like n=1 Tax=Mercenaria mercenaria TaxID=6596 RepID=UPI00234E9362|nr:interferon-induced very large GTPase 1-like [Mercenaria mercenaria]